MVPDVLCRCICGTGLRPDGQAWGEGSDLVPEDYADEPPRSSKVCSRLCYSTLPDQPLRGAPIREGELWYLSAEDQVDPVDFVLYVNGFSFACGAQETSVSLSPFALVRNCKFQSSYPSLNLADLKIFKVSLFAQSTCFYFGVRSLDDRQAEEERSRWVLDISRAMRLVTQSLFPQFSLSFTPMRSAPCTQRRLMAGYLIYFDSKYSASVLYCELQHQAEGSAQLVLYENELCELQVSAVRFSELTICCEKIGINCSCFTVEEHQFSTRTLAERKIWLRAISNLKVKLQNQAPNPTAQELLCYRAAIKEHVDSIRASLEGQVPFDPLLQPVQIDSRRLEHQALKDLPEPPEMLNKEGALGDLGGTSSPHEPRASADPPATRRNHNGTSAASPRLEHLGHEASPAPPICRAVTLSAPAAFAGIAARGRDQDAKHDGVPADGTGGTVAAYSAYQELRKPGDG